MKARFLFVLMAPILGGITAKISNETLNKVTEYSCDLKGEYLRLTTPKPCQKEHTENRYLYIDSRLKKYLYIGAGATLTLILTTLIWTKR